MAHVGKIKVPVEIICSCDRERWQAMSVLLSDALAALEACQQATIDRAVKLLRERGDYDPHRAGDFLERELRPEGTDA